MRRVALLALVLAVPVLAPSAGAADFLIAPRELPKGKRLFVSLVLPETQRAGIELTTTRGNRLGWIAPPQRRRWLRLRWNAQFGRAPVTDGRYLVRLVLDGKPVRAWRLRIDRTLPELRRLRAGNGGSRFAGDGPLLATVSPNGDGFRDRAVVRFRIAEEAVVKLEVTRTVTSPRTIFTTRKRVQPGNGVIAWKPPATQNPRTYLLRITATDTAGNRMVYGAENAFTGRFPKAPVVRVQGIDAGFTQQSYAPGQAAAIRVATDAETLTMQTFRVGPEREVVYADNQLAGVPMDEASPAPWPGRADRTRTIPFRVGLWPSGLYYVSFTSPDGRIGYAPFVVRPFRLGATSRVLVVLPTYTWQAYNHWDRDGNGYGDTWYAGAPNYGVDLSRPYIARGVPPRFYRYDLPVLHWLFWSGKVVEFVADSDFRLIRNGEALAAAYDLVLFEGHEEYVTKHMYDVVERYRDLGGNLIFLSANNFFWRVRLDGTKLRKVALFRQQGRPEARVLGVQYRANDNGSRQGLYTVRNQAAASWLWAGTGLGEGSTFGQAVGGYGIEIDATTPDTPPGTIVVADIVDVFGPGLTAQMTYYETPAGAKVFSAGTLDFGGSATYWPMRGVLDNLYARLSQP